jgi:hypothetical protein
MGYAQNDHLPVEAKKPCCTRHMSIGRNVLVSSFDKSNNIGAKTGAEDCTPARSRKVCATPSLLLADKTKGDVLTTWDFPP